MKTFRLKEKLRLIEEQYGSLDINIWSDAASQRSGTEHQEIPMHGGFSKCALCGEVDCNEDTDPIWHPELFMCHENFMMCVIVCSICKKLSFVDAAHLHQGEWIGSCCWDERMKLSE
jgi:hypothetical protein